MGVRGDLRSYPIAGTQSGIHGVLTVGKGRVACFGVLFGAAVGRSCFRVVCWCGSAADEENRDGDAGEYFIHCSGFNSALTKVCLIGSAAVTSRIVQ